VPASAMTRARRLVVVSAIALVLIVAALTMAGLHHDDRRRAPEAEGECLAGRFLGLPCLPLAERGSSRRAWSGSADHQGTSFRQSYGRPPRVDPRLPSALNTTHQHHRRPRRAYAPPRILAKWLLLVATRPDRSYTAAPCAVVAVRARSLARWLANRNRKLIRRNLSRR
jgi:hypothetical protein